TFLKNSGDNIPKSSWQKFQKVFQFTEHVDYCGVETVFGDNDEGTVINPFVDKNFSLYISQLDISNFLLRTHYKSESKVDFRNYLIFGSAFTCNRYDTNKKDTLFRDSGYCFMYDHETKTKLSFDCGPIGDEISSAHGHSDIFHFNLEVGGIPFLI